MFRNQMPETVATHHLDQKQAEQLLERSAIRELVRDQDSLWQVFFEESRDGIVVLDQAGKVHETNRRFATMLGYTIEEIRRLNVWDWDARYNQEVILGMLHQINGTGHHFETQQLRKDGTVIDVELSNSAILFRGQKMIFCICREITERKKAEAALEQSEAKFRALFHKHAAIKLLLDPGDGRILDANEAAVAFYGWSREQLRNMHVQDLNTLPPEQTSAELAKASRNEQVCFEFRHRRANGSTRDVAVYSSVIELPGKTLLHATYHDITIQRQLKEQLRQAQKMESIGILAGGVAHEFNNMLAVIIGYGQLAQEKISSDSPLHNDLQEILRAAEHSARVTRQLLAFARQHPSRAEVFDLNSATRDLLNMLRRLIEEQIEMVWQPGPDEMPVLMDPTQFDQILINLCLNARDAIAGTGTIIIATSVAPCVCAKSTDGHSRASGNYAILSICDDGCGMDRFTRERIFEPFFTTKAPGESTGLGLSVVYGTVQQNGGCIEVASTPGEGTTFTLSFPLASDYVAPVEKEEVAEHFARGKTILLVEDDPSVLQMVEHMLCELGYEVLAVDSPREAIQLARSFAGAIDLLVTDMVMPKMNGLELLDALQEDIPDIKVLFISGYVYRSKDIQDDNILGVGFLQKPFTLYDLARKVDSVIRQNDNKK